MNQTAKFLCVRVLPGFIIFFRLWFFIESQVLIY